MSGDEYKTYLSVVSNCARSLALVPVREMLDVIELSEAIGKILNPTLYHANADAMAEDKNVLMAALSLLRIGETIMRDDERNDGE